MTKKEAIKAFAKRRVIGTTSTDWERGETVGAGVQKYSRTNVCPREASLQLPEVSFRMLSKAI